jgi:hypothetical protein
MMGGSSTEGGGGAFDLARLRWVSGVGGVVTRLGGGEGMRTL